MLDRKSAPPYAAISNYQLPSARKFQLSNNTPVFILDNVTQQVIKIELIFNASRWVELKNGLSYFTSIMLEKGTKNRSAYDIADHFDRYGASIEISPGFDNVSVSLFTLTKNIEHVLPVFLELVTSPSFPENELQIQKDIFRQHLKINNEKNSFVASKLIRQHLYGKDHPYGRSMEEIDAINITQQDLFEFFNEQFQVTCVFITGFINDAIIQKLLSSFETVNYRLHNTSQVSNELEIHALGSLYIEKRESVQTSLRIGHRIITRTHEDYPSFILLNHILGGYFGSRLMKNIREEKGLTYGIYSSIHNFQHDAYFVIGADVNKKNKEIAINEIKNELLSLSNVPIQLNELNTAKNHLLGSLQLEVANPFAVIEKLKTIQLNNLANNFYSDLFDKIRNVSAITIQKTANKYFSDKFIEISVG